MCEWWGLDKCWVSYLTNGLVQYDAYDGERAKKLLLSTASDGNKVGILSTSKDGIRGRLCR